MIHTILWATYLILYLIAVIPLLLYCRYQIQKGNRDKITPLLHRTVVRWANRLIWAAGAKIEVIGEENIPE